MASGAFSGTVSATGSQKFELRVTWAETSFDASRPSRTILYEAFIRRTDYSLSGYNNTGEAYYNFTDSVGEGTGNTYFTFNYSGAQNEWVKVASWTNWYTLYNDGNGYYTRQVGIKFYAYFGVSFRDANLGMSYFNLTPYDQRPPSNINGKVVSTSTTSAVISCTASGADYYQYRLNGGSWSSNISIGSQYTIGSLSPYTTYSVQVRARSATTGVWGTGNTFSLTTQQYTPSSVSGSVVSKTTTSITVKCTATNADYYNYRIGDGSWSGNISIGGNYTITGLSPYTTYQIQFRAVKSPNYTTGNTISVITEQVSPTNVSGSLVSSGETSLTITCSATNATHYNYRLNDGGWSSNITIGQQYTISNLNPNTQYKIQVRAFNNPVYTVGNTFYGTTLDDGCVYIRRNTAWTKGKIYVYTGGTWREGKLYVYSNGQWKKGKTN